MRINWGSILVGYDFGEKIKRYFRISNLFLAFIFLVAEDDTHATVGLEIEGGKGEGGM